MTGQQKIRLLVVASVWPHVAGGYEAANIVSHAIVQQLAMSGAYDIRFLYLNKQEAKIPSVAIAEMDYLRQMGVDFLSPMILPEPVSLKKRPKDLLLALLNEPRLLLQGFGVAGKIKQQLGEKPVDAVLSIWSELGFNALSDFPAVRIAYHGNPDHKVFAAQWEVDALTVASSRPGFKNMLSDIKRWLLIYAIKRAHLAAMRGYDVAANVAANDAAFYQSQGIPVHYLQNMWPQEPPDGWEAKRDILEAQNPLKIVGNVGNLSATGNSLGLITLATEVMPALKQELKDEPFEIHLFGGREPKPNIKPLLNDPHILVRGFVDDLDAEILSSPVFLISNNHHSFKVGHTRFLHAWSLGACVVAFEDCREAMPEIKHGYNALLGKNANEVAQLVREALHDRALRRRMARGGIETLKRDFNPKTVTQVLSDSIQKAVAKRKHLHG